MAKPSICFVSMSIYPLLVDFNNSGFCAGAEIQQYFIARELAARGYTVSFVTRCHGKEKDQQLGPFRVLHAYRLGEGLRLVRFIHPAMTGTWRALKRADADIYYLRGAGPEMFPIARFARSAGRKVIFAGASDANFDPRSRKLRLARDRFLYWQGLRLVDGVIAQNREQDRLAREVLGVESTIVHNALPEAPTTLSTAEEVLWVGNLRPYKFPERFVDLVAENPDQRFVMIGRIVGEGRLPDGPVTSTGAPGSALPNFAYTGYLPPAEVDPYYARARVLVNTSDVEGFPNTFLHAWSWGVPVLTFVDPDSLVAENKLGWVVQNQEEMQAVLKKILSGELRYSPEHIAVFFRENFMTGRQVDEYESAFARVLEG